jgi:hypothetical protein
LAARIGAVASDVTMMDARRRTRSSAISGNCLRLPLAQRYSMDRFLPSIKPAWARPARNAFNEGELGRGSCQSRYPIIGISECCAPTASGHAIGNCCGRGKHDDIAPSGRVGHLTPRVVGYNYQNNSTFRHSLWRSCGLTSSGWTIMSARGPSPKPRPPPAASAYASVHPPPAAASAYASVHPPPEWRGRSSVAATTCRMSAIRIVGVRYPKKAAVTADMIWRLLLTQSGHSSRRRVARF